MLGPILNNVRPMYQPFMNISDDILGSAGGNAGQKIGTVAGNAVKNVSDDAARVTSGGNTNLGKLIKTGDDTFTSTAGVIYGPDKNFGNRVNHILAHTAPDSTKPIQTVFNANKNEVLGLIDEAWLKRGTPLPNDPGVYMVDMGRVIGTNRETVIRIVVKPGTNEIITAYPK